MRSSLGCWAVRIAVLLAGVSVAGGTIQTDPLWMLTATDGAADDQFGFAVCGDGDLVVAGAPFADHTGAFDAGAAYVYERNADATGTWSQIARLSATDRAAGDRFGCAVAVEGDVAVAGAFSAAVGGASDAGSAYIFLRDAGGSNTWGQVAKLTASDAATGDQFGVAVGVDGDVAVVGAYTADVGGLNGAGAAYVFVRNAGGTGAWGEVAKLIASDRAANDFFGKSVGVDGDTIVIGAAGADPGGVNNAGAAYVFRRIAGGSNAWTQVAKLTASDKAASDGFGGTVDVSGDVVAIGAAAADPDGMGEAGAAYVFHRNAGAAESWGQMAKLTASDKAASDEFGHAVSIAGGRVLVGAHFENAGAKSDAGSAYLFERIAGGMDAWGEVAKIVATGGVTNDQFGCAVSLSDGWAVLGAFGVDAGTNANAGAAYVVPLRTAHWEQTARRVVPEPQDQDYLGADAAIYGDVAAVPASNYRVDGKAAGAVFLYDRRAGGTNAWGPCGVLIGPNPDDTYGFGRSIACFGDTIMVGQPYPGISSTPRGQTHVFRRDPGTTNGWSYEATLYAADGHNGDAFGWAIAIDGDTAAISANSATVAGQSDAGAVYIFQRTATGSNSWNQVAKLTDDTPAVNELFGWVVALSGDMLAASTYKSGMHGVQLFQRSPGPSNHWSRVASLPTGAVEGRFGQAVSLDGNVLAVSSWLGGGLYVFERHAGGSNAWGQVAHIADPPGETESADFVRAVCVRGNTILASDASAPDAEGTPIGAVYVVERDANGGGVWAITRKLTADGAPPGSFGTAIAAFGDALVVGSLGEDMGIATNSGAVYFLETAQDGPPEITRIYLREATPRIEFTSQPAWLYDVEFSTNGDLLAWTPIPALQNLRGATDGDTTADDPHSGSRASYRVRRHGP